MNISAFNTLAERVNREFFHTFFGTEPNPCRDGIDLFNHDCRIAIELKGAAVPDCIEKQNYSFKVGSHQIYNYPNKLQDYNLYWAFMAFELNRPISEITPSTIHESITRREVMMFPWEYIHTFTCFMDDIYEDFGSEGLVKVSRLFPDYKSTPRKTKPKKQLSLPFEGADIEHRELSIAKSDLHIREDRQSQIHFPGGKIIYQANKCEPLMRSYRTKPNPN